MIPAIHYITTIYTYILVHPLTRAPETRLTHYLVARPGATVDGAKYITRSRQTTEHPTTVARHYNIRSRHTVALKPNHTEVVRSLHIDMICNVYCIDMICNNYLQSSWLVTVPSLKDAIIIPDVPPAFSHLMP